MLSLPRKILTFALVLLCTGACTAMQNGQRLSNVIPRLYIRDTQVLEPAGTDTATAVFTVRLTAPTSRAVFFSYTTRDGSAYDRDGLRAYDTTSGTMAFPAGTTKQQIRVQVHSDGRSLPRETFHVALSHVTGARVRRSVGTATIVPRHALRLGTASIVAASPGGLAVADVVARLGAPMNVPVTFRWHTDRPSGKNAAKPGVDYVPADATATIPAGQTSVDLYVLTRGTDATARRKQIGVSVDRHSTSVPVLRNGRVVILGTAADPVTTPQRATPPNTTPSSTQPPARVASPPATVAPPVTTTPTTAAPPVTTPSTVRPTVPPTTAAPPVTAPPATVRPATVPPAPTPPVHLDGFARGPRTSNLADFVNMPGDQVVVVPNGVYHGGDIQAPHAATSGPLKGWLVLLAQTQGGVTVDLTNARLWLGPNTTRVMFVGFRFVNGSIFVEGQDIDFWYTEHTFSASTWVAQSHDDGAPETGYYRAPRAIYVRVATAQRVHFYGTDVHDTGTGFWVANASDVLLEGVNEWNITEDGLDPHDVIHPDAISTVGGGAQRLTVSDSWIRGRIMVEDTTNNTSQGGPVNDILFRNMWASSSPSVGFTFTSDKDSNPRGIFGARDGVRSWGSNSGEDRTEIVDGTQYHNPNTVPSRVDVSDSNISTSPPPLGAISPADQWRSDHPYDSWADLLND